MARSKLSEQFAGDSGFEAGRRRAQSYLLIGSEVRKLREGAQLTQAALAERSSVDQADISRLEAGQWGSRGISFEILGRVLAVFGLRIQHQVVAEPAVSDEPVVKGAYRLNKAPKSAAPESARILSRYLDQAM